MSEHLSAIKALLVPLMAAKASLEDVLALIPESMKRYEPNTNTADMYYNRLRWGLTTYYELNHG